MCSTAVLCCAINYTRSSTHCVVQYTCMYTYVVNRCIVAYKGFWKARAGQGVRGVAITCYYEYIRVQQQHPSLHHTAPHNTVYTPHRTQHHTTYTTPHHTTPHHTTPQVLLWWRSRTDYSQYMTALR